MLEMYLMNMFKILGPLGLDRAHSLLSNTFTQKKLSLNDLRGFLASLVKEGKVEESGGTWRLIPKIIL